MSAKVLCTYLITKQKLKIKDNCVINDIKVFMEFKGLY